MPGRSERGRTGSGRDERGRDERARGDRGPGDRGPGGGRADRDRRPGTRVDRGGRVPDGRPRPGEFQPGPTLRQIGNLPPLGAAGILAAFAIVGMVGTLAMGHDPGFLLGFLVVVGSVAAALAIRQHAAYQIIPLPALTYLIASVIIGAIHDRATDTSKAQLGLNFLQWIASGFLAMSAATILVIVIVGARWMLRRQLVSGQFPVSDQRSASGRAPRARPAPGTRAGRDTWADADPWDDRRRRNPQDDRPPWDRRGLEFF